MKKYEMFWDRVKEGDKITVVTQGSLGGVTVSQMVYISSSPSDHYYNCPQDMRGVTLTFKPKGRRAHCKMTVDYITPLIVYSGYVDIDADGIVFLTCGNAKISRFGMHDPRYFTEILEKYPKGIIFCDIPTADVPCSVIPTAKEVAK